MSGTIDWEIRYQAGDTPWEKGEASPGLVEYLETHPALDGRILVPGCGSGHDVRVIARPDNEVIGIDIAPSAIESAGRYSRTATEQYRRADLFDLPVEMRDHFDWVWEHTCFCAIDPSMRARYVAAVADVLTKRGMLLAIFYLNPETDGDGPPFGVTKEELDQLFGMQFDIVREWHPRRAYAGREGRELMRLLRKR